MVESNALGRGCPPASRRGFMSMSRTMIIVGTSIVGLLYPAIDAAADSSQIDSKLRNEKIEIAYVQPDNPAFQAMYDRLKRLQVLENFSQLMAPLRLPRNLTVQIVQCGAAARPYQPDGPVTVCYEVLDQIEKIAAKADALAQENVIVGTFIQVLLHDVARAVFEIFQVPIWGRFEDAADNFAAFVMLQFGDDLARMTIRGSTDFFLLSGKSWTGVDFASMTSPDGQRYYNYLCMAYGSDPMTFEFLAKGNDGLPPPLPPQRAKWCNQEYETFRMFFNLRIMPYIDPDLLVIVRSMQWRTQ
jgi:Putative metallopeptidase